MRICDNGIPQLLRKPTSGNENNIEHMRSDKNLGRNLSTEDDIDKNKPRQLHHRNHVFSAYSS